MHWLTFIAEVWGAAGIIKDENEYSKRFECLHINDCPAPGSRTQTLLNRPWHACRLQDHLQVLDLHTRSAHFTVYVSASDSAAEQQSREQLVEAPWIGKEMHQSCITKGSACDRNLHWRLSVFVAPPTLLRRTT